MIRFIITINKNFIACVFHAKKWLKIKKVDNNNNHNFFYKNDNNSNNYVFNYNFENDHNFITIKIALIKE